MTDTHRPVDRDRINTRSDVLAVWFIFVVAVGPILTVLLMAAFGVIAAVICNPFFSPESNDACGMIISLGVGPFVVLLSPIVAAIACYKACRFITVPLSEAKPASIKADTVSAVVGSLLAAVGFWVWLWWLVTTQ